MQRSRIARALAGVVVAAVIGSAGFAIAKDRTIKQMMGDNFAGLQAILVALVTADYSAVPEQVEVIREHAVWLRGSVPASAKDDRDQFLAYAYNLQAHASDLKETIGVLIQRDKQRGGPNDLPTDQLREAVAAHYGGMVTMCVACHNRFRHRVVK